MGISLYAARKIRGTKIGGNRRAQHTIPRKKGQPCPGIFFFFFVVGNINERSRAVLEDTTVSGRERRSLSKAGRSGPGCVPFAPSLLPLSVFAHFQFHARVFRSFRCREMCVHRAKEFWFCADVRAVGVPLAALPAFVCGAVRLPLIEWPPSRFRFSLQFCPAKDKG